MKDWAGLLDRVLGTRLRHLVKSYQRAHPEAHCRVWSHTLGEATTYQGYTVGAEFQLPAGTLEIVVNLAHLDRAPGFELAEVSWGDTREYAWPHLDCVEQKWRRRRISRLGRGLPRLWRALKRALRRGRPPKPRVPSGPALSLPGQTDLPISLPMWPVDPRESAVHQAVSKRLNCLFIDGSYGFGLDAVRRLQARRRGWQLPDQLPVDSAMAMMSGRVSQPSAREWREHYNREPRFRGGLFLSRVAFVGDAEAYLCLRRLTGFGDSMHWIRSLSWNEEEIPWRERWDAPLASELFELIRLQRDGGSWLVADAIDLLGSVPKELLITAVHQLWQERFQAVEIPPQSKLAEIVVADLELADHDSAFDSYPKSLKVDAILKDEMVLSFTVLTVPWDIQPPPRPIERLIVVNGSEPDKIVKAIVAWLAQYALP